MHALVRAAGVAEDLGRSIRQHFVRVHVVRRAGAGLVDIDDELIAKLAAQNLVGSGDDRARDLRVEPSEHGVHVRRGLLDQDRRRHEIGWRAQPADREVLDGARGLHAVVGIGRYLQLAEWVALNAK
jgi:hypothetical protein